MADAGGTGDGPPIHPHGLAVLALTDGGKELAQLPLELAVEEKVGQHIAGGLGAADGHRQNGLVAGRDLLAAAVPGTLEFLHGEVVIPLGENLKRAVVALDFIIPAKFAGHRIVIVHVVAPFKLFKFLREDSCAWPCNYPLFPSQMRL